MNSQLKNRRMTIMGCEVDNLDMEETLQRIEEFIHDGSPHQHVVINADKVALTGKKMTDKVYYHHSGYPGGIKSITLRQQLVDHPERVIRAAVWGMLPHNKFGRKLIKRLKVYTTAEHPHEAQQPKPLG